METIDTTFLRRGRVYDPCCGSSGMFILANPPFNVSDWGGERLVEDKRWRYGVPPKGNAAATSVWSRRRMTASRSRTR